MYGTLAESNRASAAEIFAICIRLTTPSIMRAPPEAETTMIGLRSLQARSTARVIASPTTAPMLPPINEYSMALTITGLPFMVPVALMMASFKPVEALLFSSRALYGRVSEKFSGSVDSRVSSCVSMLSSSSSSIRRSAEPMRKWYSHLGHTFRFSSSSFFQMICRHPSHFTHSPSVRTRFSSFAWISLDSRLNHAKIAHPFLVLPLHGGDSY